MKRLFQILGIAVAIGLLACVAIVYRAQRTDYGWRPVVATPTFGARHPVVAIDDAHHNGSRARWWGRYWPLARLLRADGYDVRLFAARFDPASLRGVDVLVIANASGAEKLQFMGINIPVGAEGDRAAPAFTANEISALTSWVERGGSLLLVADHAPFGAANEALAAAFGITMHKGFTEVPGEVSDPLVFSRAGHRLGDHPVIAGGSAHERIDRVMTFTGQSLDGPPGSTALLRLPKSAIEYMDIDGELRPVAAGGSQAIALQRGRGRAVVLGEAAMLTAQVSEGEPFGMNLAGNDNRQFALNILHWLTPASQP